MCKFVKISSTGVHELLYLCSRYGLQFKKTGFNDSIPGLEVLISCLPLVLEYTYYSYL